MKTVAKALIFDKNDNILVLRRSGTHPYYAYHPDFPGGLVEHHESALVGVAREVEEEAGLKIALDNFKLAYDRKIEDRVLDAVYVAQLDAVRPEIRISWEHDEYEWLTKEELLTKDIPSHADHYYLTVLNYLART